MVDVLNLGLLQEAIVYLSEKAKVDSWAYGECSLIVDGMSIMEHVKYDQKTRQQVGYVDFGSGPQEDRGKAREAMVFMAGGLLKSWKIPVAYVLTNGI